MSEQTKQIGQAAWDAVHNYGAFRRDFPNDDYLEAVGAAVLSAVEQAHTSIPAEKPILTPEDINALPVGAVVMTETNPATFGVYEQRVWQKFGGVPEWQFGFPRHEWQSTDGGFERVGQPDYLRGRFGFNRHVTLLWVPVNENETTDREIRADEDGFAPGECDGSGTCSAPIHIHGCYRPHRSDECDSPNEYGHTDRENGSKG
ncbi:hypothetical protein [Microbacterium sp. AR7-10]|uniref:hypothetical protein n=1 Tax=Microbacterium sp. AR7-10 TaxID=1891970 RepID=UPI0008FC914B|nr:hypothetical protein [Microbacterium sp. AR7-10]OIU88624.1 hypothetical protein BFN01_04065 [Microbacterium sp. AR7-10]